MRRLLLGLLLLGQLDVGSLHRSLNSSSTGGQASGLLEQCELLLQCDGLVERLLSKPSKLSLEVKVEDADWRGAVICCTDETPLGISFTEYVEMGG